MEKNRISHNKAVLQRSLQLFKNMFRRHFGLIRYIKLLADRGNTFANRGSGNAHFCCGYKSFFQDAFSTTFPVRYFLCKKKGSQKFRNPNSITNTRISPFFYLKSTMSSIYFLKGLVAVCHSFCIYFLLYNRYIHTSFINTVLRIRYVYPGS